MIGPFVKCPCCAGHEAISGDAADTIAQLISEYWRMTDSPLSIELDNIRNAILNRQERAVPEEKLPLCPTPAKRKYSNLAHAQPHANKWNHHPYKCDCGYWHLSKQTPTEHAAKINSPSAGADEFEAIDPLLT